ncbi:hypothetical protein N8I71_17645 [Roseibacterium sp. SDUM158016]|uniref:hypothetical protein n=1 Tax=Roseicyclus sediminis TaxID=2980997 RepID=UPI0021CE5A86|nr:hypothetical protein [Roseibacterium sp. SDUM158016]MCU4654668.1 hypothetical protein [Roseibacterium sp. SDUM158016]
MTMKSILSAAVLACSPATGAVAQTWQAELGDSGALISARAFAPQGSLAFLCTAPSRGGRALIETGEHEALRTGIPYTAIVAVGDALLDPYADNSDLLAARATIDATTFGLPPLGWDELDWSWHVTLPMEDALFAATLAAGRFVFDPGRGTAYEYPVDGLSIALSAAFGHCIAGWQVAGYPVPAALSPLAPMVAPPGHSATVVPQGSPGHAPIRGQRLPEGYVLAPLLPLPAVPPAQGDAHLSSLCQGAWYSDPNHVQSADLDGDGLQDYVLNWSGVECHGAMTGRAFCGAANCRIDVFVSSRGYAAPQEFLGIGLDIVQDRQGRTGLLLSGTQFICSDGACDSPFFWNGAQFSQ